MSKATCTLENEIVSSNLLCFRALLARVLFLNAKIEEEASDILPSPAVDETRGKAVQLMKELMPLGNSSQPGKLFWSTGKDNKARDVELTAYMVLNLVSQNKLSGITHVTFISVLYFNNVSWSIKLSSKCVQV